MDVLQALSGGDRRSIGRANDVLAFVLKHKSALPDVVAALRHEEGVVRMRVSDALEKISKTHADWLTPYAQDVLDAVATWDAPEINWHAAQILPRLDLSAKQREVAVRTLLDFLKQNSRILRTFPLTGLTELSVGDASLRDRVIAGLHCAAMSGIPSLDARAKQPMKRLK